MTGATPALSHRLRPLMAAIWLSTSIGAASLLTPAPALARGPDGIADVAEKVIDAVVNISTSQTVEAKGGPGGGGGAMPQLPPGSPFEEFFDDFFKNRLVVRVAPRAVICSRTRPTRSVPALSSTARVSS
jgi:serine protease Do